MFILCLSVLTILERTGTFSLAVCYCNHLNIIKTKSEWKIQLRKLLRTLRSKLILSLHLSMHSPVKNAMRLFSHFVEFLHVSPQHKRGRMRKV